jgi:predicted RNA-binding Zn ribbon-like protein
MTIARPLSAEPLSLDLTNTEWGFGDAFQDSLATTAGLTKWLREIKMFDPACDLKTVQIEIIKARRIIRALLDQPGDPKARVALNELLGSGNLTYALGKAGCEERLNLPSTRKIAWLAARNYLELVTNAPDRIHQCANPNCTLYFLDTTKNGTRRWCDMNTCGNRAKAARHLRRVKQFTTA